MKEDTIRDFFQQEYIRLANVDRAIAESARDLVWAHSVRPPDCIHLATAIRHRADALDSFDTDVLALDGQLGDPPLRITRPDLSYQVQLGV